MNPKELLNTRADLEDAIKRLIGRAVMVVEFDIFALPCGCFGYTANMRGFQVDDLEVFEAHMLKLLQNTSEEVGSPSNFVFARIIPGTQEIASLNVRNLCKQCYSDFAATSGKRPRPDIYILQLMKKRKK